MKKSALFLLLLTLIFPLSAQENVSLALMNFTNMDSTGDYDYLGSLFSALIREDLSQTEDVILVDRKSWDKLTEEYRIQLTGLIDDETTVEMGKLLGCDYLCSGSFVVMEDQILLDISLTRVETGRVTSFSIRGDSEDMIHLAAEKLVKELSGKQVIFRSAESNTPIIKKMSKEPGTLKFFSHLIDARIYIDEEFYDYTTGDRQVPRLIELSPGKHRIKIDLGPNFGVVSLPEVGFEKFDYEFEIESGKTLVLEDKTRHFNEILYDMHQLIRDDLDFYNGEEPSHRGNPVPYSFIDRKGNPVEGTLTVSLEPTEKGINCLVKLSYNGIVHDLVYACSRDEELEFNFTHELVELDLDLDYRYENRVEADWYLTRNDVYQGMHRE